MKSILSKIKNSQWCLAIPLLLLSLNFSWLMTTACADLTSSTSSNRSTISNRQHTKAIWMPKRAAGKPPP